MAAKKGSGSNKGARARTYFAQQREVGERELILSAKVTRSLGASPSASTQGRASDWRETLRKIDSSPAAADATRVQRAPAPSRW